MIALVLGGTRSGKSAVAEQLAASLPAPVTYVATVTDRGDDPDLAARLAAHRARRPASWATVEAGPASLTTSLSSIAGTVLLDSLGPWVSATADFAVDGVALVQALQARTGDTVVVSEEVGLAVHPPTEAGRRFADALGDVNRMVAAVADRAWLVVAGRLVELGPTQVGP